MTPSTQIPNLTAQPSTVASRKSQPSPDTWLLNVARHIYAQADRAERARAQVAVTLRRRFREMSQSDRFGFFSVSGDWLGDGAERQLLMDLYCLNIVKPIIVANQAAMVQARVECTVEPTSKQKNLEGVAAVGRGIYKYINNHPDYWSNNLENQGNQQIQTDYGVWIHTYFDPDADSPFKLKYDEYSDQPLEEPGQYACPCGSGGPLFTAMMGQARDGQVPCPKCEQMAEIVVMPSMGETPFFSRSAESPAGNVKTELVSMFQIRIDERNTKSGNIRRARWLEHHYLEDEEVLQARVPYFELQAPQEWSYPLKWEYCLETGNDAYLKSWGATTVDQLDRRPHEVRKIYVQPEFYRHYRSPVDFTLDRGDGQAAMNRKGEPMLQLRAGQGFTDQYPHGFYFLVNGDQLLPCIEPADLRDEWAYFGFINDAHSTYYQPSTELNEFQRATNNLWTIDVQQRESASINTLVYDREWFDADDLEQQLAPTKEGKVIETGENIQNHFAVVPGLVSPGPMEGLQAIQQLKGDIVGVQPAMLGKAQPGVAYASQALQREQSLGRLSPSQYSKAEAKAIVVMQHLKWAQRCRPREWFEYIATMYGEEWKDQDIDDFLESNLELDVRVGYKEESVVPSTLIQQQLAYQQVLTMLAQAVKLTGNQKLLTTELAAKYAEKMGVTDVDIQNIDADERLADSRYRKIVARLEQSGDLPEERAVQKALASRDLMPGAEEGHETHIEFYTDHSKALRAEENPNYVLVACLAEMIERHRKAGVVEVQNEVADELEGQAPVAAVQKAMAEMQGQGAAQAEQAKAEAANQAVQVKAQTDAQIKQLEAQSKAELETQRQQFETEREAQRQEFELEKQERDLMDREEAREDEARQKEADLALRAAEIATSGEGVENDPDTEGISVNFKDLNVGAKKDLLRDRGLSAEGIKDTQVNKPTPPKGKTPERRPSA